jgi:hypothetical protein
LLAIFGDGRELASITTGDDSKPVTKAQQQQVAEPSKAKVAADGAMKALGNLDIVFYTGQFTRDERSGIDMLIVGEVNQNALQKYITELESQEGKDIRYVLMSVDEFDYRRKIKDRFITTALESKKQVIVDKNGIL